MRRIKDAKDRIREQLQTTLGDGSLNIEFTIKEKNRRILALEGEKRRLATEAAQTIERLRASLRASEAHRKLLEAGGGQSASHRDDEWASLRESRDAEAAAARLLQQQLDSLSSAAQSSAAAEQSSAAEAQRLKEEKWQLEQAKQRLEQQMSQLEQQALGRESVAEQQQQRQRQQQEMEARAAEAQRACAPANSFV